MIITSGFGEEKNTVPVEVENGILDLRGHDLSNGQVFGLIGAWEFYWDTYIPPSSFISGEHIPRTGLCYLPRYWNESSINGRSLPPFGYATYHCLVLTDSVDRMFGVTIRDVNTSYRLYINDNLVVENGNPGTNKTDTVSNYSPRTAFFKPQAQQIHITIQVANFTHKFGGASHISLGNAVSIKNVESFNVTMDSLLVGSILVMGFYHFMLFMLQRRDKSLLFFGLFCCIIALRTLFMGERLLHIALSFMNADTLMAVEYITVPLSAVFFVSFFYFLFRFKWFAWILYGLLGLSVVQLTIILFFPLSVLSVTQGYYNLIIVGICVCVVMAIIQAVIQKRKNSVIFLLGFFIIFATVVNDVLIFQRVYDGVFILSWGILFFIISQSAIISVYFAHTIQVNERLRNELAVGMRGTIQVILKLLATKDPYTAGHQRRVTILALAMADILCISEEKYDTILFAGLIHDIGKISIPSEILCKPGELSDMEFELIKTHAEVGYSILKETDFPWPIAEIVYQHHERLDGSGYPQGLHGDEIGQLAKILTVADVVEAIGSDRPYRASLGIKEGLKYIREKSGIFYDPDAVAACIELFEKRNFSFDAKDVYRGAEFLQMEMFPLFGK